MSDVPIKLIIEPDANQLAAWDKAAKGIVKPADWNKALVRALNDALAKAKTQSKREITAIYATKQRQVADMMRPIKASESRLQARLVFSGFRLPLMKYFKVTPAAPPSQKGVPVSARTPATILVRKDTGAHVSKRGFVAKMASGHIGLFERMPGMQTKSGKDKIKERSGSSVVTMADNENVAENTMRSANEVLARRLDHHMKQVAFK